MADSLRFHPSVADDLRDSIRWYEAISTELGNQFRTLVDVRFDEIALRPESFPFVFDDVRFARIRRYPYFVLLRQAGEIVRVLGVFHSASDPAKWRQRAKDD